MTEEVYCSICDGDVGTQRKRGLCKEVCEQWYRECKEERVCWIDESGQSLDFCTAEEIEDGQGEILGARGVVAADFCGMMGYKVFDAPACFNGEPLAATLTP